MLPRFSSGKNQSKRDTAQQPDQSSKKYRKHTWPRTYEKCVSEASGPQRKPYGRYPVIPSSDINQLKKFAQEKTLRFDDGKLGCPTCLRPFIHGEGIELHILRSHIRPFACGSCHKPCYHGREHVDHVLRPHAFSDYFNNPQQSSTPEAIQQESDNELNSSPAVRPTCAAASAVPKKRGRPAGLGKNLSQPKHAPPRKRGRPRGAGKNSFLPWSNQQGDESALDEQEQVLSENGIVPSAESQGPGIVGQETTLRDIEGFLAGDDLNAFLLGLSAYRPADEDELIV